MNDIKQKLVASEKRLSALFTATSEVIYSLSPDWKILRELDGRGFIKDAHKPIYDWKSKNVYPQDLELVEQAIQFAIKNKSIFQLEHRVWRADGSIGWTFSRAVPILDDDEEIIEWFGVASDITERKQAEEKLRIATENAEQQKRVYETITSTTPDLMYVFDLDYRFTYANKALLSMWGKTWENAIGKGLLENGYEPWHADMHEREIDQIKRTKKPIRGEVAFPHASLGRRTYDYILTPVFDENGDVEAVAGTTRDVTDRKNSEEMLARTSLELQTINQELAEANEELLIKNEELFRTQRLLNGMIATLAKTNLQLSESETNFKRMVEQAPVAILVFRGPELVVDIANHGILEILGKDESIIGRPLLEAMPELKGEPAVNLLFDIYDTGTSYEGTEVPVKMMVEGEAVTRYFNFSYRPLKDGEKIIGVMDVAVEVTGQVLARQEIEWGEEQLRHAIDSAELGSWYIDADTGEFFPSTRLKEMFGFGADEEMPIADCINQITETYRKTVEEAFEETLQKGKTYNVEYEVEGFHDKKLRWHKAMGKVFKSEEHKIGKFFGIATDITENKLQEQRKDDFLSIASHELKTPLTSLKSTLQLLDRLKKDFSDPMHVHLLELANRSMERISSLIEDLLQVNRLDVGQLALRKSTFVIGDLLDTCCNHITSSKKYELIIEGSRELKVFADENRIDQVLVNLVNNAVKYAPQSKVIKINVEELNGFVKISVIDNGPGINEEKIPYLFNRYYRAQTESKGYSGLGLGLYICAEIIKRHNGELGVNSIAGIGSTFWFTLPLKPF